MRGILYPTVSLLIFHSCNSFHEYLVSYVYLTVLYTCCSSLCELKCVHEHHIRRHIELDGTSDALDGVTPLIFFSISYHGLCATSYISNIKQPTKEHHTSKERRHELVMMPFDVCKSLMPICQFSAYQTERSGYYLFHFFQSAP